MKHLIFDFGQVLAHYDPAYIVGRYVSDPADAKLLEEVVFDRLYFDRLDAGTITNEETMEAVKSRIPPRLWSMAETVYYNWIYNLPEMEGMRELILRVRETYGLDTYLLSNISHYFADHAHEIPILALIDHPVYSSRCGYVKPDPAIYRYICEAYDLEPSECLFVDDRAENVSAAEALGIHGYLFDGDAAKLGGYLDEILKA